jgi:hypothetical protein
VAVAAAVVDHVYSVQPRDGDSYVADASSYTVLKLPQAQAANCARPYLGLASL